jgi:hypothetical protein
MDQGNSAGTTPDLRAKHVSPEVSAAKSKAGSSVRNRKMTESDAKMASVQARKLILPVLVTGVKLADSITIIPYEKFALLNVDEKYQRVRIGTEVNQIVHAITSGGAIPDPIDIAERPDGSWWIVDGQQRYWAHEECKLPIRAMIHKVSDHDAEEKLFIALNSRRKVSPKTIIKGWPGISGKFMRRLNDDQSSPFFGMIDFSQNTALPLDASAVLKGVLVAVTGLERVGGDMATVILPRTDAALAVTGRAAWAEEFVRLMAAVFNIEKNAGRVRILPILALAQVAHEKYTLAGRPIFPRSCAALRRVNWDTIVPTHAWQYMPVLTNVIKERWKQ